MMEELKPEMDAVCAVIDRYLDENDQMIRVPVRRTAEKKGKLLRPMLLVLTAKCGAYDRTSAITAGAALELMHIASLIHDDIVDEGAVRRGTVTVQSEFGKDVAVYAGDYTVAKSVALLSGLNDLYLVRMFNEAMTNVCRGEIRQHMSRFHTLSTEEYIEIVSQKTGELFAVSLEAGGYVGGMDGDTCAALRDIGRTLGVAYQIYDDCLDYTATGADALKDTRKDIGQGSYTLPLLCAIENDCSGTLKELLEKPPTSTRIDEITSTVRELDGPEVALRFGLDYFDRIAGDVRDLSFRNGVDFDQLVEGLDVVVQTMLRGGGVSRQTCLSSPVRIPAGVAQ
ncbi:MAG: polyprenyl synthetase family protein [Alkalispirochaeta sp.]